MEKKQKALIKTVRSDPNKGKDGRFLPGNRANPTGINGYVKIENLIKALKNRAAKQNMDFWEYVAQRVFLNDQVLMAVLKKMLPDKFEKDTPDTKISILNIGELDTGARDRLIEFIRAKQSKGEPVQSA